MYFVVFPLAFTGEDIMWLVMEVTKYEEGKTYLHDLYSVKEAKQEITVLQLAFLFHRVNAALLIFNEKLRYKN